MRKLLWELFKNLLVGAFLLAEFIFIVSIVKPQPHRSSARQSEAKIALAAIYGAEKSFYSEYAAYAGSMDAIGYEPEGNRRFFKVGFESEHVGKVHGYEGKLTTPNYPAVNATFSGCGTAPPLGHPVVGDAQAFVAVAAGCIRQNSGKFDLWNIDDTKKLSNLVNGL